MTDEQVPGPWGGEFFAIEPEPWRRALGLGMRPAIAYLMLARGVYSLTGSTKWSATSIEERTLIRWDRAKAAIQELVKAGLVRQDKGQEKGDRNPHYTVLSARQVAEGLLPSGNVVAIRGAKAADKAAQRPDDRIWMPNEVMGEKGDRSGPIEDIRISGNLDALRLFVDLYAHQDLPRFGGIDRAVVWQAFERSKLGERGSHTVWGFLPTKITAAHGPLVTPYMTGKMVRTAEGGERDEGWDRFFAALGVLRQVRLVSIIPYLFDSAQDDAEAIHPVAAYGGGRTQETEITDLAMRAGHTLLTAHASEKARKARTIVLPVQHHVRNVALVGVFRMLHLPRTNKTAEWLDQSGGWYAWHDGYNDILRKHGGQVSAAG